MRESMGPWALPLVPLYMGPWALYMEVLWAYFFPFAALVQQGQQVSNATLSRMANFLIFSNASPCLH